MSKRGETPCKAWLRRLLALVVLACMATVLSARVAYAQDARVVRNEGIPSVPATYKVGIRVDVTSDTDGWEDASISALLGDKNGRGDGNAERRESFDNVLAQLDNEKSPYWEVNGWFPKSVDIHTRLGGSAANKFEADVTVTVNDAEVEKRHIVTDPGADVTHTIEINRDRFPFVDVVYVDAPESVWLEQSTAQAHIVAMGVDQYGVAWANYGSSNPIGTDNDLKLTDSLGGVWNAEARSEDYYYDPSWTVEQAGPADSRVTYTLEAPSASSVNPTSTARFDITYAFARRVEIRHAGETVTTLTGATNQEVALDFPDIVQPGHSLEWKLEGGGTLVTDGDKGPRYVFGDSDGVLEAKNVPNSYKVVFDGNGATKGKVGEVTKKVGEQFSLPKNKFSRTGHDFAGWNTKPDGTGEAYKNKAKVQDLATEKDAVVTLYAQWKPKPYDVTFVNKLTKEETTQVVEYGSAAIAPEVPAGVPIDDESHYEFVKWDKDFSSITGDLTVTSVYKKRAHKFELGDGVVHCSVCGTELKVETTEEKAKKEAREQEQARKKAQALARKQAEEQARESAVMAASAFGDSSGVQIALCVGAVACLGTTAYVVVNKRRK
jgi:uncharacterized repeat protein (TIGR02543 family)